MIMYIKGFFCHFMAENSYAGRDCTHCQECLLFSLFERRCNAWALHAENGGITGLNPATVLPKDMSRCQRLSPMLDDYGRARSAYMAIDMMYEAERREPI